MWTLYKLISWLSLLLLLTYVETRNGRVWHCPFNTLCTCSPVNHGYPLGDNSLAVIKDVSCISVPFQRTPELPAINMSSVRIVGSGLEVLERESLGRAKISSLSLDSNRLMIVSEHALEWTGDTLTALDLSYNNLLEIPIEALSKVRNLTWLNLDSNRILNLKVRWNGMENSLKTLFLGRNGISYLPIHPDYALSNFQQVTWLTLDGNFLVSVESHALPFKVNILNLARNIFKLFPSSLLTSLSNITRLDMRDNYIEIIPTSTLAKRTKLDVLDLGENEIVNIENPFGGSIYVRDLYLDKNVIKTLPANVFKGLNCNRIFLSKNRIDTINDRAFYGMSNTLEYLDLGDNLLMKAPKALGQLKKLKYLSLNGNQIKSLPDDFFPPAADLLTLTLSNNNFTAIPRKPFRPLRLLSHLNLNYNKISEISENDFLYWGENIDILEMMNNGIKYVRESDLRQLKQLKELYLSFNNIVKLGEKCFVHLSETLDTLEISFGMESENFPESEIKPLRSLIWLSLDYNNFKNLSRTALYNFGNIKYINLEGNKLTTIPDTFFHSNVHKNLREIRLRYNKLTTLKSYMFSGLKMLESISLSDNEISHINQYAFQNIGSNQSLTITISDNQITTIAPLAFINTPMLAKLDLHGNLLKSLSLNIFQNVTSADNPLFLNLSHNHLTSLSASNFLDNLYINVLDLNHNKIVFVPVDFLFSIKNSLRKLYLNNNQIASLEYKQFSELRVLEILELSNNKIVSLKPTTFHDLKQLQILDLSKNSMEIIHSAQFKNLDELRVLDLSWNRLKSIPNDAFEKTKLERLTLAHNELFVAPTAPLMVISYNLRYLDLSYNQIEHVDSSTFANTPFLTHLNLCYNRLTFIPDNILRSIVSLVSLDLCGNKLQVNFKELFHFAQKLHYLNLADTGLKITPVLTLANLAYLNLSHNVMSEIEIPFLNYLPNLRSLDLSHNNLSTLNGMAWNYTEKLEYLDVSANPMKIITRDSFKGLENLKELNVQYLYLLERFDSNTLSDSKFITNLKVQTWPSIEKYRFRLERILSKLKLLRSLSILVTEEILFDQLGHGLSRKLKHLEITGSRLTSMHPESLAGIESLTEVTVHIHDTNIEEFPPGFFSKFTSNRFTIDLRNNKIKKFGPELFYKDPANWREVGTKKIAGGINVMGNPIECSCDVAWFGYWLRRHLRESLHINRELPEASQQMFENAKAAVCYHGMSREPIPLLKYEGTNCRTRSDSNRLLPFPVFLVLTIFYTVTKYTYF